MEDIDGAFLREQYDQDKAYADQEGYFQGDSPSPLLFCIALNPLSKELNRTGHGYRMTTGHGETAKRLLISHLLYMDDLKQYGRNSDQLDGLLHTVRTFSDNIQMKFGLDKCAVAHFVNGRLSGHNSGTNNETIYLRCALQDVLNVSVVYSLIIIQYYIYYYLINHLHLKPEVDCIVHLAKVTFLNRSGHGQTGRP